MNSRKYIRWESFTRKDLALAIKNSNSIRQALAILGKYPSGRSYPGFKKVIKEMNLDISHFGRHKTGRNKRPIEVYLSNKIYTDSNHLKKRLIKEGFFKHQCTICKTIKWMGSLVPIELHHIDGNPRNNNLLNLQILCSNCHSQTPNFNTKKQRMITFNGKTQCRSEWAREYNMNRVTLNARLNKGLSIEEALTTPLRSSRFYSL